MKKILLVILLFSFCSFELLSQTNEKIENLINIIPTLEGNEKIDSINKVSTMLWRIDKNRSLKYAKTALELSTEIEYKKGIANSLSNLGIISLYDNDNSSAIIYLTKALNKYKELQDTAQITKLYINISAIYYNAQETDKSIESAKIALDRLNKYSFDQERKKLAISTLYNNLSLCYIDKKEYAKALSYIKETIELKKEEKDKLGIATSYGNMGLVYKNLDSLELALHYYYKSIKLLKGIDNDYSLLISYLNLGSIYIETNNYDTAEYYIIRSIEIASTLNLFNNLTAGYSELSILYEKKKEYKQALEFYKQSIAYKDSVSNKELYSEIKKTEVKYEQDQLEKDERIKQIEENKNRITKYALILIIIIIVILIIVLYSRFKIKIKSERELQKINKEKDKFFSILSHDLRGPFTAFVNLSDIMANSYRALKPEEVYEYAQKINKSAIRINNLLENLLDWAVSQTGSREYTFEKVNLYKIADKNIKLLFMNANKKNIELINNIDENFYVYADLNSSKTILRNLINNAIKFTNENGEIKVEAKDIGKFYEISVIDNGVGISEENIKKIFNIDKQFFTTGTANEKGTGLGLILCKEFVEKNGGKIRVKSKLGKGTSFIFTLKKINNG